MNVLKFPRWEIHGVRRDGPGTVVIILAYGKTLRQARNLINRSGLYSSTWLAPR